MLKELLLQKIFRYAVEDIDLFDISLSVKFGESEANYRLTEDGYFEAGVEKPQECNQFLVFPKVTQPPQTTNSECQTDVLVPIQKAKLAEKIRQSEFRKMESQAKKMRVDEEVSEEIEIFEIDEGDGAKEVEVKIERETDTMSMPTAPDHKEIIHGKQASRKCPFGDHGSKRGGRTKVVCGFCMTPVCHQHVYEVCPSCIDDKRPPGKVRPFTSPAKEKFPIKNTSSPQVSQFLQAPVRQPPPLILMQSQFPNVAALNFQAQLPRSSFILPKQSDGKCPIRKIN